MPTVHGTGYVPGYARGVLRAGREALTSEDLLIVHDAKLPARGATPAGLIVVDAALFAHATLRLLAHGVPTVAVSAAQAAQLVPGERALLDGVTGRIAAGDAPLPAVPGPVPAGEALRTADGARVELRASVRDVAGAARARANGAASIGLVRSELLVPDEGAVPDTDFYIAALGAVCAAAAPLSVTVRLVDIGPDKRPAWLGSAAAAVALGMQGVRWYAREPVRTVAHAEIDAIGHLAGRYALRVLVPYVADLAEVVRWREALRARLAANVAIGAMAETPAAALAVGEWLEAVDFVALGCNDLMQCLFGADRDAPALARYLDPYAPALYRFLRQVAVAAGADIGRVQLCGLLAQLSGVLPLLLGLGFRAFSIDAVALPYLAQRVTGTDCQDAAQLAQAVCAARDSAAVRQLLAA